MSENSWPDPLFVEDVAGIRGTTIEAVYMAVSRGAFPPGSKVGRRIAWRRADVERWFADQQMPAGSAPKGAA